MFVDDETNAHIVQQLLEIELMLVFSLKVKGYSVSQKG